MKLYYVGGYVRDKLLNKDSKDVDFAVEGATYEEMKEYILSHDGVIFQERPEFLSIRARHPVHGGVDYTLCRTDGFYSDARHPDEVHIGTIFDDLARRDFTVNAIAIDVDTEEYIDPHNGRQDLWDYRLRTVGDAEARFMEDPLRLLRAVRFHVVRNFNLHADISRCLNDYTLMNSLIDTVPIERVYEELNKCFNHDSYRTMLFFALHPLLFNTIFRDMGLKLSPRIEV